MPISGLRYFFSEADNSEAILNGVELLGVELAGDDVLHHSAVLIVNIPAQRHIWVISDCGTGGEIMNDCRYANLGGVLSGSL